MYVTSYTHFTKSGRTAGLMCYIVYIILCNVVCVCVCVYVCVCDTLKSLSLMGKPCKSNLNPHSHNVHVHTSTHTLYLMN